MLLRLLFAANLLIGSVSAADSLQTIIVSVDGVDRTAIIHVPPNPQGPVPLVFVFHGHGGSSRNAERTFQTDQLWPEAISIFPQGLPTAGQLTDPQGLRPGWQATAGANDDRDLHFGDTLLAKLQKDYTIDVSRIYCTGHSNGGGFTYLLWKTRPNVFAAVAISSAAAAYAAELTPKPAMILAGESDPLVKFAWQQRMMDVVRKLNGCADAAAPWHETAKIYASSTATPLVTFVHPGGHPMEKSEAGLIVEFFKQTRGPATRP